MQAKTQGSLDCPAQVRQFQEAFIQSFTVDDMSAVVRALIAKAKEGDLAAIRLLLDRAIGPEPVSNWRSQKDWERVNRVDPLTQFLEDAEKQRSELFRSI